MNVFYQSMTSSKWHRVTKRLLLTPMFTLVLGGSLLTASNVFAPSQGYAQNILDNSPRAYRDEVAKLKLMPGIEFVNTEMVETENYLDRAEAALKLQDRDRANRYLKQARYAIEYMYAELGSASLRNAMEEQKSQIEKGEEEIKSLDLKIRELTTERERLEGEIRK